MIDERRIGSCADFAHDIMLLIEKSYQLEGIFMNRFKKIYSQGTIDIIEIWVDTETGVNYVFHRNGNAAGFTPLLDKDGKPVVTPQP